MLSLIVLAAGRATRMHRRNKLLIKIQRKPIIRRVVEAALNSKVDEVIVVLGWEAKKIHEVLADLPCRFVVNKEYRKGQSSSVKAGLREVGETTQAILLLPADIAMIDSASINRLVDAYARDKRPILIASHKRRMGHPILLSRELFREVEAIGEESFGMKAVINRHRAEVKLVETGSDRVLYDIDTPADLRRIRAVISDMAG